MQNLPIDILENKMANKKPGWTPHSPGYQSEQVLLDAYYDYRWREVLEPLYQKFQQWKAEELNPPVMYKLINQIHKQIQEVCMESSRSVLF
jgi:hypothetical protein